MKNVKRIEERNISNKVSNEETRNTENKTDANTGTIDEHNSFKKFYTSRYEEAEKREKRKSRNKKKEEKTEEKKDNIFR